MTRRAYETSVELTRYLTAVGLTDTNTFDRESRSQPEQLGAFESTGTARDWMIEGTIREDDFIDHWALGMIGCPRPSNPPSETDRVLHHFFDVQRGGAGLTVFGQEHGFAAPDWALGREGRGSGPGENEFSLLDARAYQHQSLTAPSREERDRNTALLFRSLGHVLHMLQDMAQPQHTRNDPHAGCLELLGAGEHSWYEQYIETRALRRRFRERVAPGRPLVLGGYAVVPGRPYEQFFSDPGGRGIADFSSEGFFSAGTNLAVQLGSCGGLTRPACEPGAYRREDRAFLIQTVDGPVSGSVTLYTRNVSDYLTGTIIGDVPVSSRSLWDEHLESRGLLPKFTLNTINYDAMADLLVPRAVGYSAGLLDTFFRGRIETAAITPSGLSYRLRITNRTPGETMAGTFDLYYETPAGVRKQLIGWNLTLDPETSSDWLDLPSPPGDQAAAQLGRLLLVFRGQLGVEADAVVADHVSIGAYLLTFGYGWNSVNLDEEFTSLLPALRAAVPPPDVLTFPFEPSTGASHGRVGPTAGFQAWESRGAFASAFFRNPAAVPGTVAFLSTGEITGAAASCEMVENAPGVAPVQTSSPVTFEVVEYDEPGDVAALQGYTWSSPPTVRRSHGVYTVGPDEAVTIPVSIGTARFFGVHLVGALEVPPEPVYHGSSLSSCYVYPVLRIPP